jgi:hypothetical protein
MPYYNVRAYTGVPPYANPHSFIGLMNDNGVGGYWGFAPATQGQLMGVGNIGNDSTHGGQKAGSGLFY